MIFFFISIRSLQTFQLKISIHARQHLLAKLIWWKISERKYCALSTTHLYISLSYQQYFISNTWLHAFHQRAYTTCIATPSRTCIYFHGKALNTVRRRENYRRPSATGDSSSLADKFDAVRQIGSGNWWIGWGQGLKCLGNWPERGGKLLNGIPRILMSKACEWQLCQVCLFGVNNCGSGEKQNGDRQRRLYFGSKFVIILGISILCSFT